MMKGTRIFLLSVAAATFGMVLTFQPAAAQCWSCGYGSMVVDDKWTICRTCIGDDEGYQGCGTPACNSCYNLGSCSVQLSLDGRSAAPEVPEAPSFEQPGGFGALVATFAATDHGPVPPTNARRARRSCDGGITSKWYSAEAVREARSATEQLRL